MSDRGKIGRTLLGGDPVGPSEDLDRVVSLERRPRPNSTGPEAEELIDTVTRWFARPSDGRPCGCSMFGKPCIRRLRFVQAWALFELATERGMFGMIGVGYGKTLLNMLAPFALPGCRHALLLVKPSLVSQLKKDYAHASQHFLLPTLWIHGPESTRFAGDPAPDDGRAVTLNVMSYNMLSGKDTSVFIDSIAPDLVISDELQNLAGRRSTRTRRWQRYMYDAETRGLDARFAGSSGTVTDDSLMDYWHLIVTALRENAPVPLDEEEAEAWAGAIDPSPWPSPGGDLEERLCAPGEHVQEGYYRRLVETPGVISTDAPSVDVKVEIVNRYPDPGPGPTALEPETGAELPKQIFDVMSEVRRTNMSPDGLEVFESKLDMWRCLYQLACGFWLRWEFVNGETDEQIDRWVKRRAAYNKAVRELMDRNIPYMDSPSLARDAAERFLAGLDEEPKAPIWDCWALEPWKEVEDTVDPITVAVRVDEYVARDAVNWALEGMGPGGSGIVWYDSVELGKWIVELSDGALALHDGGPTAGDRIDAEDGSRSIVASVRSHGTGRDGLQYKFARQLFLQPFASSTGWEQALGRLARVGQTRDVRSEVLAHTPELVNSLDKALERATYVERTTGVKQQLLTATRRR